MIQKFSPLADRPSMKAAAAALAAESRGKFW
jgi:hypothetical protein